MVLRGCGGQSVEVERAVMEAGALRERKRLVVEEEAGLTRVYER